MTRRLAFSAAVLLTLGAALARAEDSERATRTFVLPNGIEVLLISDPAADHSAAALTVESGSMNDGGAQGIAHFLEHMLFLGTKKYPSEAEYKDYLAQNDGQSNAYTAEDHTNYHFAVKNDAFEGALDRFSRFFIDPLMSDDLSGREVNAVDSEHSKNLQDDYWRMRQVYRSLLNPEHPRASFSTGNRETLAGVRNDALWAFYEANYSSNLMHLCVVSAHPLDTLEGWVREKFADVPNRKLTANHPTVPLHAESLRGHMIEVATLRDDHALWLTFELPAVAFDPRSKSAQILGGVLGHEGAESLLQNLKAAGLATSLSAGGDEVGRQGTFRISIGLTPQGLANVDTVLERSFGMINHLRSLEALPAHVIADRQKMAELELRFREPGNAFDEVRTLAAQMTVLPHDDLLRSMYLIPAPDQAALKATLAAMTPENAVVLVASKDRTTDATERYYGTKYRVTPLGAERIARLAAAKPEKGMDVPAANPFIPTEFALVEPKYAETPWHHAFPYGDLWLRHDTIFRQPKAALRVDLVNDRNASSAREFVLGQLYAAAVTRAINPYAYPLTEAGVSLRVSSDRHGITLAAEGFSHKLPELPAFAAPFLTEPRISAEEFALIKADMQRGIANFALAPPTAQAFEMFRELVRQVHFTPAQQAEALEALTYDDLKAYFAHAYDALRVRAVVYGNLSEEAAQGSVDTLVAALHPQRAIPAEEAYVGRVLRLGPGANRIVRRKIESNDSITLVMCQGPAADRETRAALAVLGKSLPPSFYGDLRTVQQTGYIVQAFTSDIVSLPCVFMLSQSSVVDTDSLRGRFEAHVANFLNDLDTLADDEFARNRDAAIAEIAAKSTSFSQELDRNFQLATEFHGDFQDAEKQIEALGALTRERWTVLVRELLGPNARKVSFQLDGSAERRRFRETPLDEARSTGEGFVERSSK